jgi:hypothetical protein
MLKKRVKAEAKRFTAKKTQFQKKDDENTARPPVEEEEKKPIMGKFDEYEDSSDSEASSAAIRATSKFRKHDVSQYKMIQATAVCHRLACCCQHETYRILPS